MPQSGIPALLRQSASRRQARRHGMAVPMAIGIIPLDVENLNGHLIYLILV
jgi:hypothetical protein